MKYSTKIVSIARCELRNAKNDSPRPEVRNPNQKSGGLAKTSNYAVRNANLDNIKSSFGKLISSFLKNIFRKNSPWTGLSKF